MLEPGENGELLAESCSPLVEWERSQSRPSSWPRSCGDGPYLRKVKEKFKVEVKTTKREKKKSNVMQVDPDSDFSDFLKSEVDFFSLKQPD